MNIIARFVKRDEREQASSHSLHKSAKETEQGLLRVEKDSGDVLEIISLCCDHPSSYVSHKATYTRERNDHDPEGCHYEHRERH